MNRATLETIVLLNMSKDVAVHIIVYFNDGFGVDQKFKLERYEDFMLFKDREINDWEYIKGENGDSIEVWLDG